jgi:predicted nucleotide-binding protein
MSNQKYDFYHVVIELNTTDYTKLSELDIIEKNEIVEDIAKPYFNNKTFFFDGRDIKKDNIKSLKIYHTDKLSKTLADIENNKDKEFNGFHWSKEDVVTYEDEYSKDITNEIMKDIKKQLNSSITIDETEKNLDLSKVFIVHGHDDALKLEVSIFLNKLNITPIILHEQANEGKTIIEKIEANTNVGFAIVLYTPCDIGGKDKDTLQNRARQNVVFEHGYLIGKLKRDKVIALVKGKVETPGDMSGVVYVSYSNSNSNWQFDIVKELKSAGYSIDLNKLL